jgi:hypothetical protein
MYIKAKVIEMEKEILKWDVYQGRLQSRKYKHVRAINGSGVLMGQKFRFDSFCTRFRKIQAPKSVTFNRQVITMHISLRMIWKAFT